MTESSSLPPPSLPQQDSLLERAARELELLAARAIFDYATNAPVPMPLVAGRVAYADIPSNLSWLAGWLWNHNEVSVNGAASARRLAGTTWDLASYSKVFTTVPQPATVDDWRDDRLFGAQRVAGLNPLTLALVTADGATGVAWPDIARRAAFDDALLTGPLGGDATLANAIAAKRLYVADYGLLGDIRAGKTAPAQWQRHRDLVAPIALFVRPVDFAGLEPVAIALDPQTLYRPTDAGRRWEMAKIFVQSADYNVAQLLNHLAFTHLIQEAFCLATARRLAACHPIHRLLAHHFGALLVINELGVRLLLGSDGMIEQILQGALAGSLELIRRAYARWTFADLDFAGGLAARGVDDTAALPYYPYRDDGHLLWNVLGDYLSDYIGLYYASDAEVRADYELQGWAQELAGLLDEGRGRVPGFPDLIGGREHLAVVLRRIVWTAGPQHAAVNYPQVDFGAFVPNMTAATYRAPIAEGPVDEADVLATLAPREKTALQVETSYTLAGWRYDQLLNYDLCSADASQQLVTAAFERLHGDVRSTIAARNRERRRTPGLLAYPYFLPENVPNSTSV